MTKPLQPIPADKLRPGMLCHVVGWTHGAQFVYVGERDGLHVLKTPTRGRTYTTRNDLAYTRSEEHDADKQRALHYLAGCALQCATDERNDAAFRKAMRKLHDELAKRGDKA